MKTRKQFQKKFSIGLWAFVGMSLCWLFLVVRPSSTVKIYEHVAPKDAHWICTQDGSQYTGCFRKDYDFHAKVAQAWIAVSAYGGFEVLVNGNPAGGQTLWRPTRIFNNGLTEAGQRVSSSNPVIAYNFPREYQWSGHRNDEMVTFFDLSQFMRIGLNSLCLETESRIAQPQIFAYGEIVLTTGERFQIRTDNSWKAEPVPKGIRQNHWGKPTLSVESWSSALIDDEVKHRVFNSVVPPGTYRARPPKQWIVAEDGMDVREFSSSFTYDSASDPLGIVNFNIISHSPFWLRVNGELVQSNSPGKREYNGNEWKLLWEGRRPLAPRPELMDPDNAANFFGGERFMDPRHGDPTVNDFKRFENTLNRTKERPNQTGDLLLGDKVEEKGRLQDPYGFFEEPEVTKPLTILRSRAPGRYQSYDIGDILKDGKNVIKLRLFNEQMIGYEGSQAAKFAVSGGFGDGNEFSKLHWLVDEGGKLKQATLGTVIKPDSVPNLKYSGAVQKPERMMPGLLLAGAVAIFLICVTFWRECKWLREWLFLFVCTASLYLLVEASFFERSEMIWFVKMAKTAWPLFLCIAFATFVYLIGKVTPSCKGFLRDWRSGAVCVILLLFCYILRGWSVDFQPIDDDEYASIQAALGISESGTPEIAEDIWYSRSPLYHYVAGGFAALFGQNIWALRLCSVICAVITGWLLWMIGKRYLRDRYIASAALLIFTLHPFLIFTGHIARFYQQQQMFVLLMVYLFIQGFINCKSIWYRAGAILVFACAVLSQEISVSFVPVFGILYLLFGKGVKFSWDVKAVLYIAFAGILIFADIALFKVKCLTRPTGISPNVEATLAPTFWELGNLFSMFVGYARLHLVLSFFYFVSLIYSFRRGGSKLITLHLTLLVSIVSFNLVITSQSFRYMYALIPIWILLGCHGIYVMTHWVSVHLGNKKYRPYVAIMSLLAVVISFSPWRIMGSYQEKILGDPNSSLGFVREQMREKDKIMITEPHPHAALIELGKVDYDLVVPILYDFTYNSDGVLRDRNGNAEVVNRLAQLQDIFAKEERVWVLVNREKFRSRKKNIRWEYPTAREELFLRENCQLAYRSYLWSVFLWDRNAGEMRTFRKEPKQWVE